MNDVVKPIPNVLTSRNPLRWLTIFGPGAIIASLTIGTGELIFSSRGGVIFGYKILCLFLVVCVFKWVLVFSAARHMVLTGIHPLERWMKLPGPRGWLPAVMFVFAVLCIPIWVSFHASVLGDLLAGITHSKGYLNGATIHLWGITMLACVVTLALCGGYTALENIQLTVVSAMLLAVMMAVLLLNPDWLQMLFGIFIPQRLSFPDWFLASEDPVIKTITTKPVWEEAALYVGVIGGASYDYLAYTSFLRDKQWGMAGAGDVANDSQNVERNFAKNRDWVRAPMIDCTLSFIVVFIFSAVFVASGKLVLEPQHQIPGDGSFLEHQAQFVTNLHPWLYPLYVIGTFLTMVGSLYGTLEVAPTIARELRRLLKHDVQEKLERLRSFSLLWCAFGAALVLVVSFFYQIYAGASRPPGLTNFLKPANLFTGVLSCGFICLLNPWIDRCLPDKMRPNLVMIGLNVIAGAVFVFLGMKGYWDYGGWPALAILLLTVACGCGVAIVSRRWLRPDLYR